LNLEETSEPHVRGKKKENQVKVKKRNRERSG